MNAPLQNVSIAVHGEWCALEPPEEIIHWVVVASELKCGDWGARAQEKGLSSQDRGHEKVLSTVGQRLEEEPPARTAMLQGSLTLL